MPCGSELSSWRSRALDAPLDPLGQLRAELAHAALQAVLRLLAFAHAVDQSERAVGHRAGDALQPATPSSVGLSRAAATSVVSGASARDARLGCGHPAQAAAAASLDLVHRGDHVAAQPSYLLFGVLRPCNHSRSPLNVARVRGSGGQMAIASKTPRRMMP